MYLSSVSYPVHLRRPEQNKTKRQQQQQQQQQHVNKENVNNTYVSRGMNSNEYRDTVDTRSRNFYYPYKIIITETIHVKYLIIITIHVT